MQERTALEDQLTAIGRIEQELEDNIGMIELGEAEKDQPVVTDAENALRALKADVARRETEALLSGEADSNEAYLEVHAGAGGTESQDWAEMLQRMYQRWAEKRGFKVELVEYQPGEQAGIKSATLQIKGENAYGYAKTDICWVHQIRSYVLLPYQMLKDLRTGVQTSDTSGVLDGDLDEFMAATLAQRAFGTSPGAIDDVD